MHNLQHMHPQLKSALSDPVAERVFTLDSMGETDWHRHVLRLQESAIYCEAASSHGGSIAASLSLGNSRNNSSGGMATASANGSMGSACGSPITGRMIGGMSSMFNGKATAMGAAAPATPEAAAAAGNASNGMGLPSGPQDSKAAADAAVLSALDLALPNCKTDDDEYLVMAVAYLLVHQSDPKGQLPRYSLQMSDISTWLQQMGSVDSRLSLLATQAGAMPAAAPAAAASAGGSAGRRGGPAPNLKRCRLLDLLQHARFRSYFKIRGTNQRVITLVIERLMQGLQQARGFVSGSPLAGMPLVAWEASLGQGLCKDGEDGGLPQFLFDFESGVDTSANDMEKESGARRDQFGPAAGVRSPPAPAPPPPPPPAPPMANGSPGAAAAAVGGSGSGGRAWPPNLVRSPGDHSTAGVLGPDPVLEYTTFGGLGTAGGLGGTGVGSPWAPVGVLGLTRTHSSTSSISTGTSNNGAAAGGALDPVAAPPVVTPFSHSNSQNMPGSSTSGGSLLGPATSNGFASGLIKSSVPWHAPAIQTSPAVGITATRRLSATPVSTPAAAAANSLGSSPHGLKLGGFHDLFGRAAGDALFSSPIIDIPVSTEMQAVGVPKEVCILCKHLRHIAFVFVW